MNPQSQRMSMLCQQPTPACSTRGCLTCLALQASNMRQLNIRPHNVCLLCTARAAVADEQARLAALRAQLGALEQEKAGEFEARVRGMQDLSAALQVRFLSCKTEGITHTSA